jgi:hypothetical protein
MMAVVPMRFGMRGCPANDRWAEQCAAADGRRRLGFSEVFVSVAAAAAELWR